jgi:hypothetical protein
MIRRYLCSLPYILLFHLKIALAFLDKQWLMLRATGMGNKCSFEAKTSELTSTRSLSIPTVVANLVRRRTQRQRGVTIEAQCHISHVVGMERYFEYWRYGSISYSRPLSDPRRPTHTRVSVIEMWADNMIRGILNEVRKMEDE